MYGLNTREILGMNARNRLYTSKNSKSARKIANSKFLTKELMAQNGINVARIIAILANHDDVNDFDWSILTENFVIKPSNGSGGKGIVVFKHRDGANNSIDTMGTPWSLEAMKTHCLDILEGKYSSHPGVETSVIIEERVEIHPQLAKFCYKGTPDVRVIVYNSVPVMAMLRLPTKESEGRANLHQGAMGVGVDLATGITTTAITGGGRPITYVPGTKKKLAGFLVPHWEEILLTAIKAADVSGAYYSGVDIFIDKNKGPIVVELNTSPGLSIQLANHKGLRRRLERIKDVQVLSPEHGLKIAQAMFRSSLAEKFTPPGERAQIEVISQGELILGKKQRRQLTFFVNTKRSRSSISRELATELGWLDPEDLLWVQKSESGEKQPVIEVNFVLGGKKVKTEMLVSRQLDKSKYKVHLGRKDLKDFVIKG